MDDINSDESSWTEDQYNQAMKACLKRATAGGKYDGAKDDCKCALKKIQKVADFDLALLSIQADKGDPVTKDEQARLKKVHPLVETCFTHDENIKVEKPEKTNKSRKTLMRISNGQVPPVKG